MSPWPRLLVLSRHLDTNYENYILTFNLLNLEQRVWPSVEWIAQTSRHVQDLAKVYSFNFLPHSVILQTQIFKYFTGFSNV